MKVHVCPSFSPVPYECPYLYTAGKRILDNIAEAFSPKSPTKEDNSSSARIESKENLATPSNVEVPEKKPSGRGRGRHKLYKEDTYISEPMEFTGGFVVRFILLPPVMSFELCHGISNNVYVRQAKPQISLRIYTV